VRNGAETDAENHEIEIALDLQHAAPLVRGREGALQIAPRIAQVRAVVKLIPQRLVGPAGKAAHVDQRLILVPRLCARLPIEFQPSDVRRVAPFDRHILETMKEFEAHAASPQDLHTAARTRCLPSPTASSRRTRRGR
jgi:hypothetical protein